MNFKFQISNKKKTGFSMIEALIFLFIFTMITYTFYTVWSKGTQHILLAKNRLVASALANEKMEIIRNLSFEDIAHTTSVPAGNLLQDEDVARGGRVYHVFTQIKNEDDPFDGTLLAGTDLLAFVDFKYVRITVSWDNGAQSVSASSRFVPHGIEQPSSGMGVLVINVTSDKNEGAFVNSSEVRIRNTATGLDETHYTDAYGRLLMIGLDESIKNYEITLTKNNWETVYSLPPYPTTAFNPTHEHASVVSGAVSTLDMFQNELADLEVKTVDYLGNSIPDVAFHLVGGRMIGREYLSPNDPIWSTDADYQTDSSGNKNFEDISPGEYAFTLDSSETGYELIDSSPENVAAVSPDSDVTFSVKLADKALTSLIATVVTTEDEQTVPIEGAQVRLENSGAGYDKMVTTAGNGKAYFPVAPDATGIPSGAYNMTITASGYVTQNSSVTVVADELKTETADMVAE